jgi:hypothetical protein
VAHLNGGAVALERETALEAVDCVFTNNKVTVDSASADTGDGGIRSGTDTFSVTFADTFVITCTAAARCD